MVIEIFGKTDEWSVSLKIWADHENTDLCVVRHLLIYLYCAGIKAGSLFPSEQELNNPPDDGQFKTTIHYGMFMHQLKALCSDMLVESNDKLKVGCHLFWKTGYLFAVFGHAAHHLLMMSACHESEKIL